MNPFPDYYLCLELEYGADLEDIKKNFRGLAKKYHPDNPVSGSKSEFQKILRAYQILSSPKDREIYDYAYYNYYLSGFESSAKNTTDSDPLSNQSSNPSSQPLARSRPVENIHIVPPSQVVFAHNVTEYAKKGLMRKGYRMKDRKKWTGILHDVEVRLTLEEASRISRVFIPLTVRILCPECHGSDIHCSACGGSGSYKSFRNLSIDLIPNRWVSGQILDLDLSKYRPDRLTYFKKKQLKVLLLVQ